MTVLATRPCASPRLDLGPESGDHLSLRVLGRLHPRATDEVEAGWLVCPVHVHVGGFSGDVAATLRVEEIRRFGEALRAVRSGLRRSAVLESVEGWLDLTVTVEADGSLSVVGQLADEPGSGSRLRFRLTGLGTLDLEGWVAACAAVDATYAPPVAG